MSARASARVTAGGSWGTSARTDSTGMSAANANASSATTAMRRICISDQARYRTVGSPAILTQQAATTDASESQRRTARRASTMAHDVTMGASASVALAPVGN